MVVDSKFQELTNEEIFSIAAQETGSPYSPEQVLASITAEAQKPGTILMREGNTVFVIHRAPQDETVAVFRALNADTADNYLQNSVVFTEAMKSLGFRAMVTTFYDESLLNLFKYNARGKPPGMGYRADRLDDGEIQVIVQLKPKNQGGLMQ
jgi:hypothetical protein